MGDTIWLAAQALGTMAIVLVLALVSWRQTKKMLARRQPRAPSALARATPDPQFTPDPEVTDPYHVTDAHPGGAQERRAMAIDARERQQMVAQAHAASMDHPSGVERLDGLVQPSDEARQPGADEASRNGSRQMR